MLVNGMGCFQIRLNCVDHYQAIPSDFDPPLWNSADTGSLRQAPTVPVIRIFGTTQTGQNVCAHVHGAFPYLYILYEGSLETVDVDAYITKLHVSIDHALAVSYRSAPSERRRLYVAYVSLVKGVPFYGYYVGFRTFLKIYLFNPLHITRLADLLRQGAIMQRAMQPFESHIQYVPQWMCDYNLFGCEYMDTAKVMFRHPVPSATERGDVNHLWHQGSIPMSMISDETKVQRQSHSSLEVDVTVENILNRLELRTRDIHHGLREKLEPYTNDEKVVHSLAGLWKDETKRRKARMGMEDSDDSPFPPEVMMTISADPRDSGPWGWVHEQELQHKLNSLIDAESSVFSVPKLDIEDMKIQTVFESVEELFSINLKPVNVEAVEKLVQESDPEYVLDIEIDENRALSASDEIYDSTSDHENSFENPDQSKAEEHSTYDDSLLVGANSMDRRPLANLNTRKNTSYNASDSEDDGWFGQRGVREAGNYEYIHEDAFYVPSEFTSHIDELFPSAVMGKRTLTEPQDSSKRRRLVEHEPCSQTMKPLTCLDSNGNQFIDPRFGGGSSHRSSKETPVSSLGRANGTSNTGRLESPVAKYPLAERTAAQSSQQSEVHSSDSHKSTKLRGKEIISDETKSVNFSAQATYVRKFSWKESQTPTFVSMISRSFDIAEQSLLLCMGAKAPSISISVSQDRFPSIIYKDAHFSNEEDVPERAREYGGREYRLEGTTVPYLPEFDPHGLSAASIGKKQLSILSKNALRPIYAQHRSVCTLQSWEIRDTAPTRQDVQSWLDWSLDKNSAPQRGSLLPHDISQIQGPTQQHVYGAKYSQNCFQAKNSTKTHYMSVMSLEIHVNTQDDMLPNPEKNEINCLFWCFDSPGATFSTEFCRKWSCKGMVCLLEHDRATCHSGMSYGEVWKEDSELDLIIRLVEIVRRCDPDILTGYEVHNSSWGYIIERARYKYDYNLCDELSRVVAQSHGRFGKEADRWGFNHTSTIRVTGRHTINIWRAMRAELNLLQYTFENVVFNVLQRRVPHYSFANLTKWYNSRLPRNSMKVLDYYASRAQLDLEILETNELVARTSEQARVLGVDFYSVFSRGSQFKVESLMLRIAKSENFVLVSPSRKQVGQQNALECLPLVMEPQSAFYTSPLLVLDFQSLYPSVMIAYNYCYSTFLGRIVEWRGQNKMGFTDYSREPGLLAALRDYINVAPNGIMYAKPEARKSLLAKMLGEILETRVMIKSGLKADKEDRQLHRLLHNRQLALKLIANVTYGYTSASFSGRMPCSEIADSIVQTGRETLEKAIALIHSVERWGAEVVYGDTDSLFVYLNGRTREEAFRIGEEIADAVTDMNPRPVKLKFEKVYHPCLLLAKKRYVGFKYETRRQTEPEFDAKGIETVRRDGTPAEQKIEETALKLLFRTSDLSLVKQYFQKQCMKIMRGKVSIQDFCYAREVKLGTYSDRGPPPPGALVSAKKMLGDPRAEPQYGERVPYVVIAGAPGARLIDRCVAPEVLLFDDRNELDSEYYITRNIIPPLERIFNLVGANVRQWYEEMPKFQGVRHIETKQPLTADDFSSKKTMESYMSSNACVVCKEKVESGLPICSYCLEQPSISLLALIEKTKSAETKAIDLHRLCRSCAGLPFGQKVHCDSKDCPVFFSRTRHTAKLENKRRILEPIMSILEASVNSHLDW